MKLFYKDLTDPAKSKRLFYRLLNPGKRDLSVLSRRPGKILKHAGLGGKSHVFAKGHIPWNRKGRW